MDATTPIQFCAFFQLDEGRGPGRQRCVDALASSHQHGWTKERTKWEAREINGLGAQLFVGGRDCGNEVVQVWCWNVLGVVGAGDLHKMQLWVHCLPEAFIVYYSAVFSSIYCANHFVSEKVSLIPSLIPTSDRWVTTKWQYSHVDTVYQITFRDR